MILFMAVYRVLSLAFVSGAVAVFFYVVSVPTAAAAGRYALVIGNGGYEHVAALRNPTRDAADVADTLKELGFNVTLGIDADRKKFKELVQEVAARAGQHDEVVFYFAGHGFRLGQVNRLVPVDARLEDRGAIAAETLSVDEVMAALGSDGERLILLLDACRNNPLPKGIATPQDGGGLSEISGGRDFFAAFATEPGAVASDGKGRNSPFTRALLTHMSRPDLTIAEMMVDVRKDVFASTKGKQLPFDQSSLRSQFYFVPQGTVTELLADDARSEAGVDSSNIAKREAKTTRIVPGAPILRSNEGNLAFSDPEEGLVLGDSEFGGEIILGEEKPDSQSGAPAINTAQDSKQTKESDHGDIVPRRSKNLTDANQLRNLNNLDYSSHCDKRCQTVITKYSGAFRARATKERMKYFCVVARSAYVTGKGQSGGISCDASKRANRTKMHAQAIAYCKQGAMKRKLPKFARLCKVLDTMTFNP